MIEALDLVRPGGVVIEAGAFVDMGPVEINPNRHICTKGVSVLGIGGEALEQYGPSLAMLARHQERLPFARAITHEVGLEQVEDALALAQTGAGVCGISAVSAGSSGVSWSGRPHGLQSSRPGSCSLVMGWILPARRGD